MPQEVVVLGGGISGLSVAWFLARASPKLRIRVVEAKRKLGGWVDTCDQQGFLFENGPRGFRPSRNGAEMLQLVQELQLAPQMVGANRAAKARFIMRNGIVEQIPPPSALGLLRWPMTPVFAHGILKDTFVARRSNKDDESVHEFVSRRFNATIADRVVDPVVSGIFAGNVRELSIRSCMKDLWELDQSHGSIVRGAISRMIQASTSQKKQSNLLLDGSSKSDFIRRSEKAMSVSFHGGMSTIIDALERHIKDLPDSEIQTNRKAVDIRQSEDGKTVRIHTVDATNGQNEEVLNADAVFSMIPAHQLAHVVKSQSQELSQALEAIRFASMATVHVGFHHQVLKKNGFGYLVPSCENQKILGCVFDSTSFPSQQPHNQDQTRLSVMFGGSNQPWVQHTDAEELQEMALQALQQHLEIDAKPDLINTVKLHKSIPLYHVGFWQTLGTIEHEMTRVLPQVRFAGNSFYGVGTSDCVHRAKALALEFAQQNA